MVFSGARVMVVSGDQDRAGMADEWGAMGSAGVGVPESDRAVVAG